VQDLRKQEQFEIEVLDRLNSGSFLKDMVFTGGTMLRLCYGLDRYSVDLDFWVIKEIDFRKLFRDMKEFLAGYYKINDSANKFYSILFELKSPAYPRMLKLEIRKESKRIKTEPAIAYSSHANTQVMLKTASLPDMMKAKIRAFLNRNEVRDVYDIEFLFKKGIFLDADRKTLSSLLAGIGKLTRKDYSVKLGSLLESEQRKYYTAKNFRILKMHLTELLMK
jgi:predicted nucleotidyltransferase component of viral defense system